MKIKKFIVQDVRCFEGKHTLDIKPLTILVGENSTGKTSVLGCLQVMIGSAEYGRHFNFNAEPYQMGTFADIARKARAQKEDFALGIEVENAGKSAKYMLYFREKAGGPEPVVYRAVCDFDDGQIIIETAEKETGNESDYKPITIKAGAKKNHFRVIYHERSLMSVSKVIFEPYYVLLFDHKHARKQVSNVSEQYSKYLESKKILWRWRDKMPSSSVSPIRAKPQRTYDPDSDITTHDGSEMPMVLNNISSSDKERWERLRQLLITFGKESGLFSDISVRKLGTASNDPFQLQIKAHGPKTNIADVGYGISQVLPILMRVLNDKKDMYLLQQPELHLHPKGQAALASLLVEKAEGGKAFVVETHSDYIIDRVRIEIMRKNISPDDVAMIYMHPKGNKVTSHNITFDPQGNMIGAPKEYGEFFLKESDAIFGL